MRGHLAIVAITIRGSRVVSLFIDDKRVDLTKGQANMLSPFVMMLQDGREAIHERDIVASVYPHADYDESVAYEPDIYRSPFNQWMTRLRKEIRKVAGNDDIMLVSRSGDIWSINRQGIEIVIRQDASDKMDKEIHDRIDRLSATQKVALLSFLQSFDE